MTDREKYLYVLRLLIALCNAIRYTFPRSNNLNKYYYEAKKFIKEQKDEPVE